MLDAERMTTIRTARSDDLDGVVAVGHRTWPDAYTKLAGAEYVARGLATWWSAEPTLASINAGRVAVAEVDGEIVGMTGVGPGDGCLILWKLYVVPEMQSQGIGSALLDQLVHDACSTNERAIRLEHLDGNKRAESFYTAKGFRETNREPDPDGGPDRVWMELPLDGRC